MQISNTNLDAAINGNDFGTEVGTGKYDALNGLVLLGDGSGDFSPLTIRNRKIVSSFLIFTTKGITQRYDLSTAG